MTSKLRVTPELVLECLLRGNVPGAKIVDASFDHERGLIELHLDGPGVPDTEYCCSEYERQVIYARLFPLQ